jgi:hypothetical protein
MGGIVHAHRDHLASDNPHNQPNRRLFRQTET